MADPTIDTVMDVAEDTDDFLGSMQTLHRRRLRNSIAKMERGIINSMKDLETSDSGRLKGIKVNLKQAQKIQKDTIKLFNQEYGTTLSSITGDFDEVSSFIRRSWNNLGESAEFTGVDKTMIETLKGQTLEGYEELGRVAQGKIATAMYDQVVGGGSFSKLLDTVKGAMRGHKDARGVPMEAHAKTHASDSVMNFHNQVNLKKAEDLGINHYLYVGDVIRSSRRFCITRAGNVYTRSQIESWDRMDWKGKRGPAFEFRGGWNCRHHWRPVRPEWLKEDEDGELGEVTSDEVFAQSQRKDFPEIDAALSEKGDLKKQHDVSQNESKVLKAERAKLKAQGKTTKDTPRLEEIRKTLIKQKDFRRDLKAQIVALKGDVGKQGKKIKKDVKAGRIPKALTNRELYPPKKEIALVGDQTGSAIRSVSDASPINKYSDFQGQFVTPVQEETDRMLDLGNGSLRRRLGGKRLDIEAFNSDTLPGEVKGMLGDHTSFTKKGSSVEYRGRIRIASPRGRMLRIDDEADIRIGSGWQITSDVDRKGTYRHEFGHHTHKVLLDKGEVKKWDELFNSEDKSWWTNNVSKYASTNVKEAFAESFTAYAHPNYKRGLLPKGVEGYFDGLFGEKLGGKEKVVTTIKPKTKTTTSFNNRGERWAMNRYEPWHDALTPSQRTALEAFKVDDETYFPINEWLRKGEGKLDKEHIDVMKGLDVALDKGVVPDNIYTYRGLKGKHAQFYLDNVGNTITDTGYVSSSVNVEVAEYYANAARLQEGPSAPPPIIAKIRVPKGTKASFISWDDIDTEGFGEEEILFPRDTKFRILNIKKRRSTKNIRTSLEVEMEVI